MNLTRLNLEPWLAPNKPPILIESGIVATGATVILLPTIAGVSYYLFDVFLQPSPSAGATAIGYLQYFDGTTATRFAKTFFNALVGAPANVFIPDPPVLKFSGAQLPAGDSVRLENQSGANEAWGGYITYSTYQIPT